MWFLKRLDRYLCLLWHAIDAIFRTFSKKMRLNSSFWLDFGDFRVDLAPNLCFWGDLVPISPIYQHPHWNFPKIVEFLSFHTLYQSRILVFLRKILQTQIHPKKKKLKSKFHQKRAVRNSRPEGWWV